MMLLIFSWVSLTFSALPCLLFLRNLRGFKRAGRAAEESASVSILIPARNEERAIAAAIAAALATEGATIEVVVLDDHSEDATRKIVESFRERDPRVRLIEAPSLPAGWCGKQHACWTLAHNASFELMLFLDADTRLSRDAVARSVELKRDTGSALASAFPYEETETILEKLLIPLIHFVLLGFLPLHRMRKSVSPGFAAGCGQFMLTDRESYFRAGGHAAIRASLHDGITLPRAFRRAGLKTDVFDGTDIATCRMYASAREVWLGLAKNATEGLASPRMIAPATILLTVGQVAPFVLAPVAGFAGSPAVWPALAAMAAAWLPRALGVLRFKQSVVGAVLHPAGIALLIPIQWHALGRRLLGAPARWKDRSYEPQSVA